ncbi:MAG: alpha/beta hydrolase [Hydrogenophaga sp.]|nr:alpha/beta hydrolase [Hydrogenophaga sp.]MDO9250457.1 alpha/beta hydrolase [Hydrogenophaga sp.]MDP2406014.1 alpha/beta hydrolase [Hydrogenophaga sp.]MDP3324546.1 alpha/beta hydrolase [Hydrogenophaga sp.]MDZ4176099.1 alpha/beta hydrolase [Hydrogenophaga sp.]
MKHRTFLGLVLTLWLVGCASLPDAVSEIVDNRKVEHLVAGQGSPVVIFENGLGGTLDWWAKVWPDAVNQTTSLAYHRAGYGKSEASTAARDGTHIVEELRALLKVRQLDPPYILVGHSLGGLYMQLFARKYPKDVASLVLVDATHPEQLKGAGDPEAWPAWLKLSFGLLTSGTAKQELAALNSTGQAVLSLPVNPAVPVTVLSALRPMEVSSPMVDDANRKRADLANLYPRSRQVWVDSGHGIPLEKPEAVVEAVRAAVHMARASRPSRTDPASTPCVPTPQHIACDIQQRQ